MKYGLEIQQEKLDRRKLKIVDKKILALATCHNRCEKTQKCLETLIKGNPNIQFDFIIVDDGSTDGTKLMLEEFEQVTIIEGNGNLFYSGGMRMAIDKAKKRKNYDYCMFFNDDVTFFDNAIERMLKLFKPEYRILVGATCGSDGKITYAGVNKLSKWIPKCEIVYSDESKLITCDTFNANCVLIEFNTFLKLDNIDPVYVHGMGDYDYGFNASRKGIKLYVSNFFCGICDETTEHGSWRDKSLSRRRRFAIKNNEKGTPNKAWFHYLLKNYNFLTAIVYSLSPYVRILLGK